MMVLRDSARRFRIGVLIFTSALRWADQPLAELSDLCRAIEAAGYDFAAFPQHLSIPPENVATLGRTWCDPFTLCSVTLSATTHLRAVTTVAVAPLYPLALLRQAASTLSWLSGGRFELGLGAGYLRADFGSDEQFARRHTLLREMAAALHAEEPSLPLWIGGRGVASAALARRLDATWAPSLAQERAIEAGIAAGTRTVPVSDWLEPEHAAEAARRLQTLGAAGTVLRLVARTPAALAEAARACAVSLGLQPAATTA